METNKEKVEKTQGVKTTEKREMSNGYVAKQLLLNAKRLAEKNAIDNNQFIEIRAIAIDVITKDL